MKRLPLFLLLIISAPASAQLPAPRPSEPTALDTYLNLSPEQRSSMARLSNELQRFLSDKLRRVAQVEQEIRVERGRESLDALALGIRYVELETICRESRDRRQQTMRDLRSALNPTQLQRLAALEQAWALWPLINAADSAALIEAPATSSSLPQDSRALPGCQSQSGLFAGILAPLPTTP